MPLLRHLFAASLLTLLSTLSLSAQSLDPLTSARVLVEAKDYGKATEAYKKLYEQNPGDGEVYTEYLNLLLQQKNTREAARIVDQQLATRGPSPVLFADRGRVYEAEGKRKKAEEEWDKAVQYLNGDDAMTQMLVRAFTAMGNDAYTLKAYERARDMLRNPYLYGNQMARLYAKTGNMESAVDVLLDAAPVQAYGGADEVKALLLELLGTDPKKLQLTQKALLKRSNQQPDNPYYPELLTWLYTQKDDWEGALIQVQALDARAGDGGRRLLDFARTATREEEFATALQAIDAVLEKGDTQPYFVLAGAERLSIGFRQLQHNLAYTQQEADALAAQYAAFFDAHPDYFSSSHVQDYAKLEAQYAGRPQKGIELLNKALAQTNSGRPFTGQVKLQLGDYQTLIGNVWEASLTYSQVDKAFREDALGEEARFRNAKLAYYRGDFDWAQGQLSVLKASTSELIANDALYLSVLITENVPPDSNLVPLRRFAYADMLLFQNKDKEAETLLDSLSTVFPKHPLTDDILLLRASLAQKHRDYAKAISYLERIHKEHGDDVLGDDAVFRSAELYDKYLKQAPEAKRAYEQLIIEYPGSTYVQSARQRLKELEAPAEGAQS